jgi:TetR/AcrR family transcriptional regulator of autoinduction and epiphytic fitness
VIVEALLSLFEEGELQPSAERLAERAGVSRRLIFHHFRDLEDLFETAADKQTERVLPTLRPLPDGGPLPRRIEALVARCCDFFERVAPVRRAALLVEPSSAVIAKRLQAVRRLHRFSVEKLFAPELEKAPPEDRAELSASLAAVSSFSFWEELRAHQGLTSEQIERALIRALTALLSAPTRRSSLPQKKH